MTRAVLTAEAHNDLQGISDFIAQTSLQSSAAVIDYIIDQLQALARSPTIGRERQDLWPGVFCFVVGKNQWRSRYLIFYRIAANGIVVARIIEGHRDVRSELKQPSTPL